jgi:hypothetical protein
MTPMREGAVERQADSGDSRLVTMATVVFTTIVLLLTPIVGYSLIWIVFGGQGTNETTALGVTMLAASVSGVMAARRRRPVAGMLLIGFGLIVLGVVLLGLRTPYQDRFRAIELPAGLSLLGLALSGLGMAWLRRRMRPIGRADVVTLALTLAIGLVILLFRIPVRSLG